MTQHRPFLCLIAALLTGPVAADVVRLPAGAVQIGSRADNPTRYALPVGRFDGRTVPTRTVTGALDQRAWRLDGLQGNTLSLLQPLADQLAAQGYQVIFTCQTTECGGFDFRFAVDVLPEPQMHVDLGDFLFLSAQDARGDAVSLLVSRSADQGFVQVTAISAQGKAAEPATAAATEPAAEPSSAPKVEPPVAASVDAPVIDAAPSLPPTDFDGQLLQDGSVALDDLVFASGKADLNDQDYPNLAALAAWLVANPTMKVTLVGHTDASGTLAGNVVLSKQRAASVRDWLVKRYQADPTQIDAQGAGYLAPRTTNQTPEGRTKNRRVEVMLTSTPVK